MNNIYPISFGKNQRLAIRISDLSEVQITKCKEWKLIKKEDLYLLPVDKKLAGRLVKILNNL